MLLDNRLGWKYPRNQQSRLYLFWLGKISTIWKQNKCLRFRVYIINARQIWRKHDFGNVRRDQGWLFSQGQTHSDEDESATKRRRWLVGQIFGQRESYSRILNRNLQDFQGKEDICWGIVASWWIDLKPWRSARPIRWSQHDRPASLIDGQNLTPSLARIRELRLNP